MSKILIDGIEYRLKKPADEKELEEAVKEHSKEIFGEESLYFDLKHRLSSKTGVISIPDGYVISLSKPYEWYIVEGELSDHPLHEHITTQLNKFYMGMKNPATRKELTDSLFDSINDNKPLRAYVEEAIGSPEIKGFLIDLISKSPRYVVAIEEMGDQVRDACEGLKAEPIVIEFKTFVRENAGVVHAHLFKPLYETSILAEVIGGTIDDKIEAVKSGDIKALLKESVDQLKTMGCEIKPLKGRWMSIWYKGKRFMYIGARTKWFVCQIEKPDGKWTGYLKVNSKKLWNDILSEHVQPKLDSIH